MFWKKKEILFGCEAVNYLDVIEVNGENLDTVKEELFEYFKKSNRYYSKSDIQKFSEKFTYDVWRSFIWIDSELLQNNVDSSFATNVRYRFLELGNIDGIEIPNLQEEFAKHINKQDFYTRKDIQDVAIKLGFPVFNRCNWQYFTITTRTYIKQNLTYYLYHKRNTIAASVKPSKDD